MVREKTIKRCIVCGTAYEESPSGRITCSDACDRQHRSDTHRGTSHQWTAASRATLAVKGQTRNLTRGTPAAQQSPIAGPFETNQEAKYWWVVNLATMHRYHVRNLRKFCRDNAHLFAPDPWERACAGLRQVQAWLVGSRQRQVSRWKEWTLERPAVHPDELRHTD
jgi:predicted nucleic acid-binding Zn ribbon protein